MEKAKDYIAHGEVMQVQMGQRISRRFADAPISLYRALRSLNPSPYMYCYLQTSETSTWSARRLEFLVRGEVGKDGEKHVCIRPIAGSRRQRPDSGAGRRRSSAISPRIRRSALNT
ncbi:MAG: chorismate-binding protein [Dakarella massiliensis]